jgi:hypothetical protein
MSAFRQEQRQQQKSLDYQQKKSEPNANQLILRPLTQYMSSDPRVTLGVSILLILAGVWLYNRTNREKELFINECTIMAKSSFWPFAGAAETSSEKIATTDRHLQRAWLKQIKNVTKITCQRINNDSQLQAYNNPTFFQYISHQGKTARKFAAFPPEQLEKLNDIFLQAREIGNDLIGKQIANVSEKLYEQRELFVKDIRSHLITQDLDEKSRDKTYQSLLHDINAYIRFLQSIMLLQVKAAFTRLMGGGFCGEFASFSTLEILRAFDLKGITPMPSIAMLEVTDAATGYIHSLVSINGEEHNVEGGRLKASDVPQYFCDSWLHELQSKAFFSSAALSRHALMGYSPHTISTIFEVGIIPSLDGQLKSVRDFFSQTRKRFIHEEYKIPSEQRKQLLQLKQKLTRTVAEGEHILSTLEDVHDARTMMPMV